MATGPALFVDGPALFVDGSAHESQP